MLGMKDLTWTMISLLSTHVVKSALAGDTSTFCGEQNPSSNPLPSESGREPGMLSYQVYGGLKSHSILH